MTKRLLILSSLISVTLGSCSLFSTSEKQYEQKYVVIWQNYNGDILEIDRDLKLGDIPTYDGETPERNPKNDVIYFFEGWSPEITPVEKNTTYTATFTKDTIVDESEYKPVISEDNKYIYYGLYPQSHVSDLDLINSLNEIAPNEKTGWCLFNEDYYVKKAATVYNNESYTFDDGTNIANGEEYWFKCEPIKWNILKNVNNEYEVLSDKLLDSHNYYDNYQDRTINGKLVYANNYKESSVRDFLNDEFYNVAFAFNNSSIKVADVDNSGDTFGNSDSIYSEGNTEDKVYLLSYKDYLNSEYGFDTNPTNVSTTRECKTTDYARATGSWVSKETATKNNGSYWTRSPSDEYKYCAINVNAGGHLSTYAVDGNSHSIRPALTLNIK